MKSLLALKQLILLEFGDYQGSASPRAILDSDLTSEIIIIIKKNILKKEANGC